MSKLSEAIEYVERNHPLPRCLHGQALRDHSGETLEPPCGCQPLEERVISIGPKDGNIWLKLAAIADGRED